MKSDKVDSTTKVAPQPTPLTAETDSPVEKNEIAHVDSCEKFAKSVFGEVVEIWEFLKLNMLEDMDACAKFVDGVRWVVFPSSFAKHTAILATESMLLDQEDTKAANGVAKTMVAEAYSSTEKIKRLESELTALKKSNISALTSLRLKTVCQKIVDLNTRLYAIQIKYENAEK
ncbi:hypothetical protein FF1_025509 [Malus domestica]